MRRPKPVKPFKTLQEEADFWDTHDTSMLLENPKATLSHLLPLESKKTATLTLRLQRSVKERITQIARLKGINPATLSRMWLVEKLQQTQ
jgi:hypothetical protein